MNDKNNVRIHPASLVATKDRDVDRENLARQIRTNQMMREQARELIQPTPIISDLINIDLLLQGEQDIAGNTIPLEKDVIASLRLRADIKFRLLSKVLPDLKATESVSHNTHDHAHLHADVGSVSNMELAQRLQLWRRDHLNPEGSLVGETTSEPDPDEEIVYDFL